jgi:hypothetical protein
MLDTLVLLCIFRIPGARGDIAIRWFCFFLHCVWTVNCGRSSCPDHGMDLGSMGMVSIGWATACPCMYTGAVGPLGSRLPTAVISIRRCNHGSQPHLVENWIYY